eukprot:TRINITY_DN3045_c0_g2_i2.p1 TRINITY_DN3045_c0_g2~~TRINITY_DN3045_c0_g2_i2.p1  ORF type:complete len:157 (+),score=46.00 TRINITY_DN3045_c0_g2_i2:130-600(+)
MVHCLVEAKNLPRLSNQAHVFELLERALLHVVSLSSKIEQELQSRQAGPHASEDARHQEWLQRTTQLQQKALRMQKETFLALFERFSRGLAAHMAECRASGEPEGAWLVKGLARLRQCGRKYFKEIKPFMGTLESVVMSTVNELRVSEVFESFKEF